MVVEIAMTVKYKQYQTGKYQGTMYVVLLKSSYKALHEKGRNELSSAWMTHDYSSSEDNYVDVCLITSNLVFRNNLVTE